MSRLFQEGIVQRSTTSKLPMSFAYSQRPAKRARFKSVSWAPDERLWQVRLFSAEDAPSVAGSNQQQLQAKENPRRVLNVKLPPRRAAKAKADPAAVASVKTQTSWRKPEEFAMDADWMVVAGDASEAVAAEAEREKSSFEAIYPRASSVPENPAEPVEAQEDYEDEKTPLIPLIAIEEEEMLDPEGAAVAVGQQMAAEAALPIQPPAGGVHPQQEAPPQLPPSAPSGAIGDSARGTGGAIQQGAPDLDEARAAGDSSQMDTDVPQAAAISGGGGGGGGEPVPDFAAAAAVAAALSTLHNKDIDQELLLRVLTNPGMIAALLPRAAADAHIAGGPPAAAEEQRLPPVQAAPPLPHHQGPGGSLHQLPHPGELAATPSHHAPAQSQHQGREGGISRQRNGHVGMLAPLPVAKPLGNGSPPPHTQLAAGPMDRNSQKDAAGASSYSQPLRPVLESKAHAANGVAGPAWPNHLSTRQQPPGGLGAELRFSAEAPQPPVAHFSTSTAPTLGAFAIPSLPAQSGQQWPSRSQGRHFEGFQPDFRVGSDAFSEPAAPPGRDQYDLPRPPLTHPVHLAGPKMNVPQRMPPLPHGANEPFRDGFGRQEGRVAYDLGTQWGPGLFQRQGNDPSLGRTDLNMEHSDPGRLAPQSYDGLWQGPARNSRPCTFFNTPRGCKKGSHCPFAHEPLPHVRTGPLWSGRQPRREGEVYH